MLTGDAGREALEEAKNYLVDDLYVSLPGIDYFKFLIMALEETYLLNYLMKFVVLNCLYGKKGRRILLR